MFPASSVARLIHPEVVRERLAVGVREALLSLSTFRPLVTERPVRLRARFASTTRADVLQAVPGMRRVDGYTVEYDADGMTDAYGLIRIMYKYIAW